MKLLRFIIFFLLSWLAIFHISNVAMDVAFKFLVILLHRIGDFTQSAKLKVLAHAFPNTMIKAQTFYSINRDNYKQLVVCEKCSCTYEYSDCIRNSTGSEVLDVHSFVFLSTLSHE